MVLESTGTERRGRCSRTRSRHRCRSRPDKRRYTATRKCGRIWGVLAPPLWLWNASRSSHEVGEALTTTVCTEMFSINTAPTQQLPSPGPGPYSYLFLCCLSHHPAHPACNNGRKNIHRYCSDPHSSSFPTSSPLSLSLSLITPHTQVASMAAQTIPWLSRVCCVTSQVQVQQSPESYPLEKKRDEDWWRGGEREREAESWCQIGVGSISYPLS